jgi:hypothetical protein
MATKRPGDDSNGHSAGNGAAPDVKKAKDVG